VFLPFPRNIGAFIVGSLVVVISFHGTANLRTRKHTDIFTELLGVNGSMVWECVVSRAARFSSL
jgi:hypothetical protein